MLLKNLIFAYLAITVFIAVKYLFQALRCRLYLTFVYLNIENNSIKNLKYIEPIQELLRKFGYNHKRNGKEDIL